MRPMLPRLTAVHAAGLASLAACSLATSAASAAPEAHLFRIVDSGTTITTLLELAQTRRIADVTAGCAPLSGDAALDCRGSALERPGALFSSFELPEKNALFTLAVGGSDVPLTFEGKARWADLAGQPGIGTAWLVLVDAASTMGSRFAEAKDVAAAFLDAMGPGDVADVMVMNHAGVVLDSRWVAQKAQATAALAGVPRAYPPGARVRPLFNVIKQAATDGFKDLAAPGSAVTVPLHQALVVISNGWAGADAGTSAASASVLRAYLSKGRFPENGAGPKMPVPVISIWLPTPAPADLQAVSSDFMEGLANAELGGFFTVVRSGGAARAPGIVSAVRTRFGKMHVVRWRSPCAAGATQTYKLAFMNTTPPIAGDASFQDVPVGARPPCKARP